ncbi:unnamed protein product [Parnassius mnemosyne]|uniref:Acyl-CoA desaturase n=1 Tax=Parnassius mnemosyne TaxID=213953 RepID=A0AAV1LTE2_9NEOP
MAPDVSTMEMITSDSEQKLVAPQAAPRKFQIVYRNLLTFGYAHLSALYGLYLACTSAKWQSIFFFYILFVLSSIGITAGAHRLWTHKAYKANMPLQIILMLMNSLAFQNTATD